MPIFERILIALLLNKSMHYENGKEKLYLCGSFSHNDVITSVIIIEHKYGEQGFIYLR